MAKLLPAAIVVGLLTLPSVAHAGANDRSTSRPWSLQIGTGPMINLEGGGAAGKLGFDFQYHFSGGDTGPALGGLVYTHFAENIFGMNIAPIFLWDLRVYRAGKFKLYLAPLLAAGYAFTTVVPSGGTGHAFFMDFGGQLKGVVNDRVGFFIRPINFSMWANNNGATGFWTLLLGVTISF